MIDRSTVLYYCPCYKSPADLPQQKPEPPRDEATATSGEDETEEETSLDLQDTRLAYALYTLEDLYFCYDCNTHRCPRCVTEELVSLYCPNCLFEVPGKSQLPDRHCPRNCFRCPDCHSSLQTLGEEGKGFTLSCTFCHWSSVDVGLTFVRASNLVSQISSQRSNARKVHFDQVKKYLVKEQQGQQEETPAARYYRQYKEAMNTGTLKEEQYTPATLAAEDCTSRLDESLSKASTRLAALPLHTPLRSKRTKRCRQCRLLLVKPDPKPLSLHFRSRLYARNVLPNLHFQPCAAADLVAGVTAQWCLKVTNALSETISVTLSTQRKTAKGDYIIIVAPELIIGANSEDWEEDGLMPTKSTSGELLEAGRNWANVMIQITPGPNQSSGQVNVAIPIFVQVKWEGDDERDHQGERTKAGKVKKELGFWAVLDFAMATRITTT